MFALYSVIQAVDPSSGLFVSETKYNHWLLKAGGAEMKFNIFLFLFKTEMSHRSSEFNKILNKTESLMRELL